jgi:hypothetical protein
MITSILLIAGCSSSMAEKVDPEQARSALNTALDAWKGGKSNSDLAALEPSLLMNESDWSAGNRLLDYKMEENGRLHGRQVRWVVQIKLQDKSGKVRERKATYIIDTIPRIVIVRDTFAS